MKQATYRDRDWSLLPLVIVLGIMVGAGMGIAARALVPFIPWVKSAPVETVRAKRNSLLLPGSHFTLREQYDLFSRHQRHL
jgi:hypothetical protein